METLLTTVLYGNDMQFPELKYFGYAAIAASIVFPIMWIVSATTDGSWTFGVNSLSDMGISDNAFSAFMFNSGCMITGLFGMAVGLAAFVYGKKTIRYGSLLYMFSMLSLFFVGVFTLRTDMHYVVATLFFVVCGISIIVISVSDYKVSWYLYTDIILVAIMAITMMTLKFEVWEPIYTICSIIWTLTVGIKMLIGDERLLTDVPQTRRG